MKLENDTFIFIRFLHRKDIYRYFPYPMPESSGVEMLRYFMEQHELATADLPEIGSPDVVSEVLDGRRDLTLTQVRALAKRFHILPAVFL